MSETADVQPPAQNPAAAALQASFEQAAALHRQGRLAEAERICREVLRQQPNHFGALHLLGLIALDTRHMERAVELFGRAIALKPDFAEAYSDRGMALRKLKRFEDALASYDRAIALKPDFAMAHNNRANTLLDLKRPAEALASCDQAIALKPDLAMAHNNRGNALLKLKRPADALASYDKAITLESDLATAYNNRGMALHDLNRPEEALASCDKAIALTPNYAEAYSYRAAALLDLKRPEEALASCEKAIALKSDFVDAYNNRGNVLRNLNRSAEALASYDQAIVLNPDYAIAHKNRGTALELLKRYDEAIAAYDKAFALEPDIVGVEASRLYVKMQICDWNNFDSACTHLISSVRNGKVNPPFHFLAVPSSPNDQFQCAKLSIADKFPPSQKPIWQGERYDHNRIRVAYLSPDFREHATSYLTAGMFECHDKSHFDITAISVGPDDNSEIRQRLRASFERFIDARTYSDDKIANLLKEYEMDIVVDLAGFTQGLRTSVFAKRPAPIQINYLGYPGTMGAPYVDYIVADRIVIPESEYEFYSEKIVTLPNSYQANDSKRSIADKAPMRTELGLPSQGFVFCCFNRNYKITPRIFDCWMRILKQVEASVLWLIEGNASAVSNLRNEAVARGVDARRLIFAEHIPLPDHLARQRLADLFLDTLPYNAHTTASDALWAGLPVLTCLGETFAGRVAASLLNAIGLPELITTTLEDYEQMAIDFATQPEKLKIIKRKLAKNRLTTPLFDTKQFTKHIETAYAAMYERHQAGLPPDHIIISN